MSHAQQHKPRLVPIDRARSILGNIGRTKLYELIGAGELRAVKLGRRTLLVEDEVLAYAVSLPSLTTKPMIARRSHAALRSRS